MESFLTTRDAIRNFWHCSCCRQTKRCAGTCMQNLQAVTFVDKNTKLVCSIIIRTWVTCIFVTTDLCAFAVSPRPYSWVYSCKPALFGSRQKLQGAKLCCEKLACFKCTLSRRVVMLKSTVAIVQQFRSFAPYVLGIKSLTPEGRIHVHNHANVKGNHRRALGRVPDLTCLLHSWTFQAFSLQKLLFGLCRWSWTWSLGHSRFWWLRSLQILTWCYLF